MSVHLLYKVYHENHFLTYEITFVLFIIKMFCLNNSLVLRYNKNIFNIFFIF